MYSMVFVDMSNFVKAQGVMPSNYHESEIVDIPKCFYTHWSGEETGCGLQNKEDMIIMENLIPRGFVFISHGDICSNKVAISRPRYLLSNLSHVPIYLVSAARGPDGAGDRQVPRHQLLP